LEVFNETVEYYGQLQQDGRIESFEPCLLDPHGGDLAGFILLRGSSEQMDSLHHDEEFQRRLTRASFIVDKLGIIHAYMGEELGRQMARYQAEVGALV
ncbi:MAG: hypothetical protein ACRDLA_16475, partial [Thermoleophilaceae bacterium]